MNFPNAYKGVKKIFTAEIFAIVSLVLLLICPILAVVLTKTTSDNETAAVALAALIVLFAGLGLAVASFVVNLTGIVQAKKDEGRFYYAFVFVIIPIIASIFVAIFSQNTYVQNIANTVNNVCEVMVMIYIIGGIRNLAEKLGDGKMVSSGNFALRVIITIYVLLLIARITAIIFCFIPLMVVAAGIISIIAGVLDVFVNIYYFFYLGRAVKMLKQ